VAEKSGQIDDLGLWVLEETCKNITQHLQQQPVKFAINLSPIQLSDPCIVDNIHNIVSRYRIPPQTIEFEITESCIIHNMDDCLRVATALNEFGFSLSIDDFGTGYSSFSRLIDLPIARLKLDRQLIRDITVRNHAATIVKGMINIAHDIGIRVVAEGVECEQQATLLQSLDCDYLQGFYVGEPSKTAAPTYKCSEGSYSVA
ncbi:MAG: EAL domain-containing protein, partial [Pseudomonadota bacterium]